jgi:hypothetical protein
MSVRLTSWILGPEMPPPIEAFQALVTALLERGVAKGPWLLLSGVFDGDWRPLDAMQAEALARGETSDQLKAALGQLDLTHDLACVFAGLDGKHPDYAFHYAEPTECVVAVVRLRAPVEVRGEKLHANDESDFPGTVPVSVSSASWLMLDGAQAPYEGELRNSYLHEFVESSVEVLTVAS